MAIVPGGNSLTVSQQASHWCRPKTETARHTLELSADQHGEHFVRSAKDQVPQTPSRSSSCTTA